MPNSKLCWARCLRNCCGHSSRPLSRRTALRPSADDLAQLAADKGSLTPEHIQQLFALFTQAEDALRFSAHPRFVLETAAVKATRLLRKAAVAPEQPARAASSGPTQPAAVRSEKPPTSRPGGAPIPSRSTAPSAATPAPKPAPGGV